MSDICFYIRVLLLIVLILNIIYIGYKYICDGQKFLALGVGNDPDIRQTSPYEKHTMRNKLITNNIPEAI